MTLCVAVGVVMRSAKLYRSAVELLEAILANKRAVKAQQFEAERRRFLLQLKRLSLRKTQNRCPRLSNKSYFVVDTRFLVFGLSLALSIVTYRTVD